jgi:2-polyprenyl-3-methyl-5-hydroxy-6-metoxy-1,4-benzoquinol methylase
MSLSDSEKKKYEDVHKVKRYGLGPRQLNWIKKQDNRFTKEFVQEAKIADNALDIGCGGGTITEYVRGLGCPCRGIDISEKATKKGRGLSVMNADNLSFLDDTFTFVFHLDGLEHIHKSQELACLTEAVRVCNKGGSIFYEIALKLAGDDQSRISRGQQPLHVNLKTKEEWLWFFDDNKGLGYDIEWSSIPPSKVKPFCIILRKI